ncbi:hypothetical protein ANRL4_02904 [Anaerolineae bacterium]|nr:hypothetical protein ANRL4_02904 [Anaerolineae bacterium]
MLTTTVHPQWIAEMYPGTKGRDHLGLGSVSSERILQALSPGIYVLTIHPRYFSFYVFLLDEFWQRGLPRKRAVWKDFYRRHEFIYSVGANLCDQPQHKDISNIVGSQKTAPLASQELDKYVASTNYIKSDFGGYGLYYRAPMLEMELIYPFGAGSPPLPLDAPSEEGKKVAEAFRQAVRDTTYYRHFFDKEEVPLDVIREYIRCACLCQLRLERTPDRGALRKVYLTGGRRFEPRVATFRLLLDIAAATQGHEIYDADFRNLLYFGATQSGVRYSPRPTVSSTYLKWRLYQAREYYSFALNALWYYLCDWGLRQSGDVRPIPLSTFWQHIETALNFDRLATKLGLVKPHIQANSGFMALLDWLERIAGASGAQFDAACTLNRPLNEEHLYNLASEDRADRVSMITGMVTMLALIYLRFSQPKLWQTPEWAISQMGAESRLSVAGFLRQLQRRLKSGPVTIGEVVRWLYNDYVIVQHQLIATSKLPENTFRFQREGDALRFYNLGNELEFMNSRYFALSTTIHELGFCGDLRQANHKLTRDGQYLLEHGTLI